MKVLVLGAGIIGVSTAWHLLAEGHEVTVVDRQSDAALETSFANGAQISVSFCEPWASAAAPWKVARWLTRDDAPLLFRPQPDWRQWRWGLRFLQQCTDAAFERNVAELVALGRYSHEALHRLVAATGIDYHRVQKGILHLFSTVQDLATGSAAAALMRRHGVDRRVMTRDEVLDVEPALRHAPGLLGGTYTPTDESGDAREFTQALARLCAARGARFLWDHEARSLDAVRRSVVLLRRADGARQRVQAEAIVVALGSFTAPFLRAAGVDLDIYPTKGYSATLALRRPDDASVVSLIDDAHKIAISRLGDTVRIAGTAEMAGYDTRLDTPTARLRCQRLVQRYDTLFPGVADLREPHFWAGLRPSTPDNRPLIGPTPLEGVWVNAGHGTLGWTHGAGSGRLLAQMLSGRPHDIKFRVLQARWATRV